MRKAFTLIELLCVIVIVAILAGMASTRFEQSIGRRRVEAAANRILTDLEMLRGQARLKGASRSIVFSTGSDAYSCSGVPGLNDPAVDYAVVLSRPPYEVDLVSCNFGGDATLTYDMYGRPDSSGTLFLRFGDWTATVTVEAGSGKASWAY